MTEDRTIRMPSPVLVGQHLNGEEAAIAEWPDKIHADVPF
jgi:hypothetical protein